MKKRRNPPRRVKAHQHPPAASEATRPGFRSFTPVKLRPRRDGFSPERQLAFIEALAECGCVEEACQRVGISAQTAYALNRRIDAASFRQAWDAALDFAVRRLSDAMFSRAIKGVSRPIFYKGEQVGERIYYDERAAMFILRHRDPAGYGKWRDQMFAVRPPDAAARTLNSRIDRAMEDAHAIEEDGYVRARPPADDYPVELTPDPPAAFEPISQWERDEMVYAAETAAEAAAAAQAPASPPLDEAMREEVREQAWREVFGDAPRPPYPDAFAPAPAERAGPRIRTFDNWDSG